MTSTAVGSISMLTRLKAEVKEQVGLELQRRTTTAAKETSVLGLTATSIILGTPSLNLATRSQRQSRTALLSVKPKAAITELHLTTESCVLPATRRYVTAALEHWSSRTTRNSC